MGLDITAYMELKPLTGPKRDAAGHSVGWGEYVLFSDEVINETEKDFAGTTAGLSSGIYCWAFAHRFRAGSYGGYGDWRRDLARFAGTTYEQVFFGQYLPNTPFVELIRFYDNQGVIGPIPSAKLAADFTNNAVRARDWASESVDDEWLEQYENWMIAFALAAYNGAVDFH